MNNYSGVKPENIRKLKRYMHNGLSVYQILQDHVSCLTTPILYTIQSCSSGRNNIFTPEIATNTLSLYNCN